LDRRLTIPPDFSLQAFAALTRKGLKGCVAGLSSLPFSVVSKLVIDGLAFQL
jgi:hypothetical protein